MVVLVANDGGQLGAAVVRRMGVGRSAAAAADAGRGAAAEALRGEGAALVGELVGAGAGMGALEEAALVAQHFSGAEVGTTPGAGIGGTAVEAAASNTVSELCRGVVCVNDGDGRGL